MFTNLVVKLRQKEDIIRSTQKMSNVTKVEISAPWLRLNKKVTTVISLLRDVILE